MGKNSGEKKGVQIVLENGKPKNTQDRHGRPEIIETEEEHRKQEWQ